MQSKVVLLGSSGAGKSCLFRRYIDGDYYAGMPSTLSAACAEKVVDCGDQKITLFLWDTAGSEKFQSVSHIYYRNARIGLIVFDVTAQQTFSEVGQWVQRVKRLEEGVTLYLVGQKCDSEQREVSSEEAARFAEEHNMIYKEVSAKTGQGVCELFTHVAGAALLNQQSDKVEKVVINVVSESDRCC